jgi:hypothetical protein
MFREKAVLVPRPREGMMKRWMARLAMAVVMTAAAGGAYAQCAGFTDVVDDGTGPRAFCPGPATVGNFAAGRCQLTALVLNRNPTSVPFDEQ